MTDQLTAVHALAEPAEAALADGAFAEFAPRLRQALAACSPAQRQRVVLPDSVWRAMIGAVVARLGPEQVAAWFGQVDCADPAAALAEFWFRCAAGEIGFDA